MQKHIFAVLTHLHTSFLYTLTPFSSFSSLSQKISLPENSESEMNSSIIQLNYSPTVTLFTSTATNSEPKLVITTISKSIL